MTANRPVVFRLYPDTGSRYVRAVVWPTHATMATHARTLGYVIDQWTRAHCFGVLVRRYGADGRQWTRGVFAEAHFYRDMLTPEVVSHEMQHAVYAWARRVHFRWSVMGRHDGYMPQEERLCYLHTRLCAAFVERAHRAGLYGGNWWRALDFHRSQAA